MARTRCFSLLIFGVLLATAGFAEDDASRGAEENLSTPPSLEKLPAESAYAPRWRLTPPAATAPYAGEWRHPIADMEFQNSSGLARVTGFRTLSFFTLARSRQARLFFGVNEEGLVGFHYRAISRKTETRDPEPVRTPNLSDSPTASEANPGTE